MLAQAKGKCVCEDGKMPSCAGGEAPKCPNGDAPDLSITQLPDPFSKCTENWFEKKNRWIKTRLKNLWKFVTTSILMILCPWLEHYSIARPIF